MGRPPKGTSENSALLREKARQQHQDERDRIPIEGKFGQGKRRFSLNRVMAKLAQTSETAIAVTFIVMNLEKWLHWVLGTLLALLWESAKPLINVIRGRQRSGKTRYPFDAGRGIAVSKSLASC